jgi:hypothetical protein
MRTTARGTRAIQQFKELAFTARMAGEVRIRARAAWKAAVAAGLHPDEIRRLEVHMAVSAAREATAQTLADEAWQEYLAAARHG